MVRKKMSPKQKKAIKALKVGIEFSKKHVTKANLQKALTASKKATSYISGLLKKKKKEHVRTTMTMYRK